MHVLRNLTAAVALAGLSAVASAGSLGLDPADTTLNPGDSFSLKVLGSGFAEVVVGGGFNLSFDASLLQLDSVTINTAVWEFAANGGLIDNASGTLSDATFNTFLNSPTGNFEAATLNFTSKGAGTSTVTLSAAPSFVFSDLDGNEIATSFGSASVTAVPEPATVITMLMGLALLPTLRRRLG
jgi:hypothetical protein